MSKESRLCRLNLMHLQDKPDELEKSLEKMLKDIEEELNSLKESKIPIDKKQKFFNN